jgi:hypothetical protein
MFGVLALADQCRGFEAIHAGHVDVEQYDGKVALEQALERLAARIDRNHLAAQVAEYGLQRQQLVWPVVHDQDVQVFAGGGHEDRRGSQAPRVASRCSGITGLAM